MDPTITTTRMRLRPITLEDLDRMHELHNDPEVMRFLTGGAPISRETIATEIGEGRWDGGYWAAERSESGEWLGWFALHPVAGRDPGERELGYRLCQAAWGQGYATEGARVLVAAGFVDPAVNRIWAETMAVNTGSRRVMEKVGLRFVRIFHVEWDDPLPGADEGEVEYALTRAEWEATADSPNSSRG